MTDQAQSGTPSQPAVPQTGSAVQKIGRIERFRAIAEVVKIVFEVLAIIGIGGWVVVRYVLTDPAVDARGKVDANLSWETGIAPRECLAVFGVGVTNEGKRTFKVDSVRLKVWIIGRPLSNEPVTHIDPVQLRQYAVTYDLLLLEGPLIGKYPQEASTSEDYVFAMRPDSGKLAIFQLDGWAHATNWTGIGTQTLKLLAYEWEPLCHSVSPTGETAQKR